MINSLECFIFTLFFTPCIICIQLINSYKYLYQSLSDFMFDSILQILYIAQILTILLMKPIRTIKTQTGIRDFAVCSNQRILVASFYDIIRVYDTDIGGPILSVKLDSSPRVLKLSPNGQYFIVHQSNNTISIYETSSGTLLQKILETPSSIKNIRFSKNSQKFIYGNSKMLCIWNVRANNLELGTEHWQNTNCYDVNMDGTQFAIGNYNGTICIVSCSDDRKFKQIQVRRHKTCVMVLCFHENKLISASYDGHFLISTLLISKDGERQINYNQLFVSIVPRDIESVGNNFYMFDHQGVNWFSNLSVVGFADTHIYKPLVNQEGQVIFVKLMPLEIEWWPLKMLKN